MANENALFIGLLKWFDDDKGFGVISTLVSESEKTVEVFFHHSNWRGKGRFYGNGNPLVFNIRKRNSKNGYEAVKCKEFQCSSEQWQLIFSHRLHNTKAYVSDYSKADIFEKCIAMITTDEDARNFVAEAKNWETLHPTTDLSNIEQYLVGGKSVSNPIFINFLKGYVTSLLDMEQRRDRFKKHSLSLAFFSTEECMSFLDDINVSDCLYISTNEPTKALKLISAKLQKLISEFSFEISFENYASSVCGNLQRVYEAFCDIQPKQDEQDKYKILINDSVLEHKKDWEELCISIAAQPKYALKNWLSRLLQLPPVFNDRLKSILRGVTISYLKKKLSADDVIWLMLNDGLDIDEDYISTHITELEDVAFEEICEYLKFSDEYLKKLFNDYILSPDHIDEALSLIKSEDRLRDDCTITNLKQQITIQLLKLENIIPTLVNYFEELSEDFVYDTTIKFLDKTHNIKPVVRQIASANSPYCDKIRNIVIKFHEDHPDWVSHEYVNAFAIGLPISFNDDFYVSLLIQLHRNSGDSKWCMEYANKIGGDVKAQFEKFLISCLTKPEYIELWKNEICSFLPEEYLEDYFDNIESKYINAASWLSKGRINRDVLINTISKTVENVNHVYRQKAFQTKFFAYRFFVEVLNGSIDTLIDCDLAALFNWVLNNDLNVTVPKEYFFQRFVLFPEDVQVRLLKKIFACKVAGKFDFTLQELNLLKKSAVDYQNEYEHPKINLSVSVIIDSLLSYVGKGKFLTDKELFTSIFRYAGEHSKEMLRIGKFFDKCTGKKYRAYPYNLNEKENYIFPISDSKGHVWYIIRFAYDGTLVSEVKDIEGRRYHPQFKIWFVPENSQVEVWDFAERNNFLILNKTFKVEDISKPLSELLINYDFNQLKKENKHLSTLKDSNEQPPKEFLCEGKESQNSTDSVWWCIGHYPCSWCAMKTHHQSEWENYTLLDFCKAFNLNVSEENIYGQFKNGEYAKFLTLINKFNQLLEHLYCRECGELLYPTDSNYSVNGATNFCCTNENCSQHGVRIYLNHCYSQRCRGVIDDRDAARCPNGLVICKKCGTCCTTEMFNFTLHRRMQTGSPIPDGLKYKVEHNAGHLDQSQFYCYKCGVRLTENPEHTICQNCGTEIQYNIKTSKY